MHMHNLLNTRHLPGNNFNMEEDNIVVSFLHNNDSKCNAENQARQE